MSEGFRMAGFDSVLGVDCWETACETFSLNHSAANVLCGDISEIRNDDFLETAGLSPGEIGIVCGGPPCQGFSLAGTTIADDPRNYLYKHFLRAVSALSPAWVVMENVPSLLSNDLVGSAILNDFKSIRSEGKQYEVAYIVLNAAAYGVPQTRSRLFFVAKRNDIKVRHRFSTHELASPLFVEKPDMFRTSMYISCWDAISDLPQIGPNEGQEEMPYDAEPRTPYQHLMRGRMSLHKFFELNGDSNINHFATIPQSAAVYNHVAQQHSAVLVERFRHIPPGGSKEDLRKTKPHLLPPEGHPEQGLTYGRLWLDRPASAIPANFSRPSGNRSIHPTSPRLITPREAMRLSSFPDFYRLIGLKVAQREQVGNAVPPLMAFHIASYLRSIWEIEKP